MGAANSLGLLPADNIDALDVIPEPASVLMMLFGGFFLTRVRKMCR
jgi:hypothetical protein